MRAPSAPRSIADDDATPSLSINDVTVNEAAGTATFTVTLSAASGLAGGRQLRDQHRHRRSGGLHAAAGTLNFAAGVTSKVITVPINDDTVFENSETFNVAPGGGDERDDRATARRGHDPRRRHRHRWLQRQRHAHAGGQPT